MTSATTPPTSGATVSAIEDLDRTECLRLLAATRFGRIAVGMPDGSPVIRPVNYRFDEPSQSVVVRTEPGLKLHALLAAGSAAFEIDGIDPRSQTGWSVIITGVAEAVTAPSDLKRRAADGPETWTSGPDERLVRIRAFTVSGRRICRAASD